MTHTHIQNQNPLNHDQPHSATLRHAQPHPGILSHTYHTCCQVHDRSQCRHDSEQCQTRIGNSLAVNGPCGEHTGGSSAPAALLLFDSQLLYAYQLATSRNPWRMGAGASCSNQHYMLSCITGGGRTMMFSVHHRLCESSFVRSRRCLDCRMSQLNTAASTLPSLQQAHPMDGAHIAGACTMEVALCSEDDPGHVDGQTRDRRGLRSQGISFYKPARCNYLTKQRRREVCADGREGGVECRVHFAGFQEDPHNCALVWLYSSASSILAL